MDMCEKENETTSLNEACRKYCQEMAHAAQFEAEITEVFEMAMQRANQPWPSTAG